MSYNRNASRVLNESCFYNNEICRLMYWNLVLCLTSVNIEAVCNIKTILLVLVRSMFLLCGLLLKQNSLSVYLSGIHGDGWGHRKRRKDWEVIYDYMITYKRKRIALIWARRDCWLGIMSRRRRKWRWNTWEYYSCCHVESTIGINEISHYIYFRVGQENKVSYLRLHKTPYRTTP